MAEEAATRALAAASLSSDDAMQAKVAAPAAAAAGGPSSHPLGFTGANLPVNNRTPSYAGVMPRIPRPAPLAVRAIREKLKDLGTSLKDLSKTCARMRRAVTQNRVQPLEEDYTAADMGAKLNDIAAILNTSTEQMLASHGSSALVAEKVSQVLTEVTGAVSAMYKKQSQTDQVVWQQLKPKLESLINNTAQLTDKVAAQTEQLAQFRAEFADRGLKGTRARDWRWQTQRADRMAETVGKLLDVVTVLGRKAGVSLPPMDALQGLSGQDRTAEEEAAAAEYDPESPGYQPTEQEVDEEEEMEEEDAGGEAMDHDAACAKGGAKVSWADQVAAEEEADLAHGTAASLDTLSELPVGVVAPKGFSYVRDPESGFAWRLWDETNKVFHVASAAQTLPAQQVQVGSGSSVRIPQPAKFSGESADPVEDVLFAFENYLVGSKVPRVLWPVHAMPLLTGKALQSWVAFAQPRQLLGVPPTWDEFRAVLSTFSKPDRQITARQKLLTHIQTGTVQEYLQEFKLLVAQCGSPQPRDKDLMLMYWKGLKPGPQRNSSVNPATAKFWETFEGLAQHTVSIELTKKMAETQDASPPKRPPMKLKGARFTPQGGKRGGRAGGFAGNRGGGNGGRKGGGGGGHKGNDRGGAKYAMPGPSGVQKPHAMEKCDFCLMMGHLEDKCWAKAKAQAKARAEALAKAGKGPAN